tara:strand:- start:4245 stop:5336 length:1092 start_codon:yes stop_codon:yes gene_type:complete
MSKLATKQDLSNIIEKAVKRIGKDQANIRDTEGVTITNEDIKKEQEELIEESLKEAANEAAEKLVLENTITGMVKGVMSEMGGGSGFADNQGSSNTLAKFNKRQEVGEQDDKNIDETKLRKRIMDAHNLKSAEEFKKWLKENPTHADAKEWAKANYTPKELKKLTPKENTVNESTTDMIKKLVSKKLRDINEVEKSTPSLDQVKKSKDKSGEETKKYHNEVEKKFKEYSESDNAEENSPMYRNDDEQSEFVEDWRGMGLEDSNGVEDLERISDYLGGSSKTGNAQVDEDGNDLGNVVSSELGEKIEKKIKRKREKIETQKSHMRNARGYSPAVQKTVKESVNESVKSDMEKIKKLFNYNDKTQ